MLLMSGFHNIVQVRPCLDQCLRGVCTYTSWGGRGINHHEFKKSLVRRQLMSTSQWVIGEISVSFHWFIPSHCLLLFTCFSREASIKSHSFIYSIWEVPIKLAALVKKEKKSKRQSFMCKKTLKLSITFFYSLSSIKCKQNKCLIFADSLCE